MCFSSQVITPDNSANRPDDFLGFPIIYVPGFRLIFYRQVQLTRNEKGELISDIWGKRGATYGGNGVPDDLLPTGAADKRRKKRIDF